MKQYIISEELRSKIMTIINNGVFQNIRHGEIASVTSWLLQASDTDYFEEQIDERDRRIEELVERLVKDDGHNG